MTEPATRVARKVKAKRESPGERKGTVRLRSPVLAYAGLAVAFILLAAWMLLSDLLFLRGSESVIVMVIGAAMVIVIVVFFVLPLFIGNVLTDMTIRIRYGIQFREEIPLYEIERIELVGKVPASSGILGSGVKLGVTYSAFDERFTVLRSKRGVVRIVLAKEIMVSNWLIPRRVKEIVFDTLDGDKVAKRIEAVKAMEAG